MTPALHDQILERLLADDAVDDEVVDLVDAACSGDAALEAALSQQRQVEPKDKKAAAARTHSKPAPVYLKELALSGFRGVGPEQKLRLEPGPGLTLVLGRNGSGKSSFAEGLETLLTGQSRRWLSRPRDWMSGWKNLHTADGSFVEATFFAESSEPLVVRRIWKQGAELEDAEVRVRRGSERLDGLQSLKWDEALVTFRPFLSYSELGSLLDEPSKLYDELKSILGLEEVSAATKRLEEARKQRDRDRKTTTERLKQILPRLEGLDDPRAQASLAALSGRNWELDEVEAIVLGDADGEQQESALTRLRRLAELSGPSLEEVEAAIGALRVAIGQQAALAGSSEAQNAKLAALLEAAIKYRAAFAGPCPVCECELAQDWGARAQARLEEAHGVAGQVRTAVAETKRCATSLRNLIRQPPAALLQVADAELPTDALDAWRAWADAPEDPAALCDHAESRVVDLVAALQPLRKLAEEKRMTMESAWRPVARELAAWLDDGRRTQANAAVLQLLKKAVTWMKNEESQLRDHRFEPIAEQSQRTWALLRQESNVELAGVELTGTGTRRKVSLDVSVDGQQGVAVSVMSQGELNALALSLFLPRMTLAESPFHFLVVDDPVQAMDPHKVDGLARVLDETARTRQVIVLTHDTRLAEALDRLGIEATVLEVTRRARSVVEIQTATDPVLRHLRDARDCLRHEDKLGPTLAGRTVPGFCRLAIEAACVETIRRRRLARGDRHADVERAIAEVKGLHPLAALAIEDDPARGDRVYEYLNNKLGHGAGDAFRAIKEGSHHGYAGSLNALVRDAASLARTLRGVR